MLTPVLSKMIRLALLGVVVALGHGPVLGNDHHGRATILVVNSPQAMSFTGQSAPLSTLQFAPVSTHMFHFAPAATQTLQLAPASAPTYQLAPAAAQTFQLAPAASQTLQLAPTAAQTFQLAPASAPTFQLAPAATQTFQLAPAAAQTFQLAPASSQTLQLAPAAQTFQLAPAAAQSFQMSATSSQFQLAPTAGQTLQFAPANAMQAAAALSSPEDQDYFVLSQGFGGSMSAVRFLEDFAKGKVKELLKRGGVNKEEILTLVLESAKGFLASRGFGFVVNQAIEPILKRLINRVIADGGTPSGGEGTDNVPPPAQPVKKPSNGLYEISGKVYIKPASGSSKPDEPTPGIVTPGNNTLDFTIPNASENASPDH